jgi:hypothetical protein
MSRRRVDREQPFLMLLVLAAYSLVMATIVFFILNWFLDFTR